MREWIAEGIEKDGKKPMKRIINAESRKDASVRAEKLGMVVFSVIDLKLSNTPAKHTDTGSCRVDSDQDDYVSMYVLAILVRIVALAQLGSLLYLCSKIAHDDAHIWLHLGLPALTGAVLLFAFASLMDAVRDIAECS